MHRIRFLSTLVLAVIGPLYAGAADGQPEATLPMRKAGLWELKTSMDEGNGPREQSLKMCIDDQMERNTVLASVSEHKANCTNYNIQGKETETLVEADCVFNKRKVVSTTHMLGDFKTAFEIQIESTTSDPEAKEQTVVVKRTIKQNGKYLAENCGELKAGEAEGADGKRMLVQ